MGDDFYTWEAAIVRLRKIGDVVIPLDQPAEVDQITRTVDHGAPARVQAFAQAWVSSGRDAWQALLASLATDDGESAAMAQSLAVDHPLRRLISSAAHAAIVWGERSGVGASDLWDYILHIPSGRHDYHPGQIRLHRPASHASIAAAEAVLGARLPPSYVQLLRITNGLGIDEDGRSGVAGAGPQRADWNVVTGGQWLDCERFQEIAAQWREFQGIYAYERERDAETGEQTFISDEKPLIPFMVTYGGDDWCLDRSRQRPDGECPVVYWDHETREAYEEFPAGRTYPTFAQWIRDQLTWVVTWEVLERV